MGRFRRKKLKPNQVLEVIKDGGEHPELKEHIERIKNSDLKHPILAANIAGELVVLDGVHRLAKSFLENKTSVLAIKFEHCQKKRRFEITRSFCSD